MLTGLRGLRVLDPAGTLRQATQSGSVVVDEVGVSLTPVADAERTLAHHLHRLLRGDPDGVAVLAGPPGPARDAALAPTTTLAPTAGRVRIVDAATEGLAGRAPGGSVHDGMAAGDALVVTNADMLGLRRAAALLSEMPDGARLELVGDPEALPGGGAPAAGAVLADMVASGVVPIHRIGRDGAGDPTALGRLDDALRAGRLPPLDPDDHDLVVLPVSSVDQLRRRVDQLVRVSIPRAYQVGEPDVGVLAVRGGGSAGAVALADLVAGHATAHDIAQAAGHRWLAVVLVLPAEAAGSVTVPLLCSALGTAERHLSIVTGLGDELARLVATRRARSRRTRLRSLLAAGG